MRHDSLPALPDEPERAPMWRVSLRDLQWRRRRFVVAVLATGLVFALTLLMAGAAGGLHAEARRIVALFEADTWLVADGASGPFTTVTGIPESTAADVAGADTRAEAVVLLHSTLTVDGQDRDANVVGRVVDGLGAPVVVSGRDVQRSGEVVADQALGLSPGDTVTLSGTELDVVGIARDVTYYFGTPTIFVTLADAQAVAFSGRPLAMTVAVQGVPERVPPGFRTFSSREAQADLERPLKNATESIDFISFLLWVVAAGIIGSIVYLSALERVREFAVMKATGASNRALLTGLALQALVLAGAAALVGAALARVLTPAFPFTVEITFGTYARLAAIVIVVGLLASIGGLRRAVGVDPALAFGGA